MDLPLYVMKTSWPLRTSSSRAAVFCLRSLAVAVLTLPSQLSVYFIVYTFPVQIKASRESSGHGLGRESALLDLRFFHSQLNQSRKVQPGFGLFHIGESRLGCGLTRTEELAAILIRDAGGLQGARPAP